MTDIATLSLYRGDTLKYTWSRAGSAPDLAGATARMQIRDRYRNLLADAAAVGSITIDPAAGTVTVTLPAAVTAQFPPGSHKFDLELTLADGTVVTVAAGFVQVLEDITHD